MTEDNEGRTRLLQHWEAEARKMSDVQPWKTVLAALDAARAEVQRLTAERDSWKSLYLSLRSEATAQLDRLERLTADRDDWMQKFDGVCHEAAALSETVKRLTAENADLLKRLRPRPTRVPDDSSEI